jgi:hypothetical protein
MATTQIQTRQIADNAVTNAKIPGGAGITSDKLADGSNFVKKDGTVTMTGSLNMGSQGITNLAVPSTGSDAANKTYVDSQIANLNSIFDSKGSARVASTGNVTLATPGAAIDGITLSSGDRILLKNQSAPAENGIYVFASAATPLVRATDFDAWSEIPGGFLAVEEGSTQADTIWLSTSNQGGTLGTTAITFQQIPTSAGLLNSNFVDKEVPGGSINGSNVTFTLTNTPVSGSEHIYLNGVLQEAGAGNDYTILNAVITILSAPLTGEKLRASYRK